MGETAAIVVRYWASARAAAGTREETVATTGPVTLAALVQEVVRRHPDARLAEVIAVCSVLVDEQPVATEDPAGVEVPPGATVDFLPPFAGG